MNLDEINSPLPPRRVPEMEPEVEEKKIEEEPKVTEPVVEMAAPAAKKSFWEKNGKLIGIIGGIIILLVVALVLLIPKKSTEKEQIVLNYWGLWENETVMNSIISDYEDKNPGVTINYKRNQLDNYRTRLVAKLAKSGTEGSDDIDIFRIHNTWIPMFRNYLEPVPTNEVSAIGLNTDFFNVYSSDLKENGQWLSVPLMYDGLAMFYNKDLLTEAGIDVPKSWWDLEKAATQLTTKDKQGLIQIAGASLGTANTNIEHWSDIVGLMMKQNGIDFAKNVNTDTNLDDALKFYASFAKSDNSNVWDDTLPNATELFANGKLAFYFGNSWRVFDLATLNKDLNYGITTMPQLPKNGNIADENAELTNINWASYWTEGVNNKSKHKDAAWKFLEYLSSKEVLEKLYAAESQTRSFGEIYPRRSMMDELKDNDKVWPFVSVADNATSWYLASSTGDNGVNTEMQKYFTDAINSMSVSSSNTTAITTLKSGVSQLQTKYSLKR